MVSLTKWLIDHEYAALWIAVILLFLPPVAICILASLTNIFSDGVSAGDVLTYLAGYGAFIGTVGLGCAAIHQADQAKKQATHDINVNTKRPFFIIDDVSYLDVYGNNFVVLKSVKGYCHNYDNPIIINVKVKNIGDGIADRFVVKSPDNIQNTADSRTSVSVIPNDWCTVQINPVVKPDAGESKQIYTILYQNIVGVKYQQSITVTCESVTDYETARAVNSFTVYLIGEQKVLN